MDEKELDNKFQEKNKKITIKNKYKKERLESKLRLKEEKEQIRRKYGKLNFMNFFTKFSLLGLLLVVTGIAISLVSDKFVVEIISNLCSTIGVALLIGSIFDFSKNSEDFIGFVSKILKDIIISKKFLSSLGEKDKKEALKIILQPSYKQIEQYSNINEYFKKKIDDSMEMFETNFKTGLALVVDARKDENGIVYCESLLTYEVYKVGDKFEPIKVCYEKDGSETKELKIIYGEKENVLDIPIQNEEAKNVYSFEIPDTLKNYDKLTIQRKVYEPGNYCLTNFIWRSITPYEGIKFYLKCHDGLIIKEHTIYDKEKYYHVNLSEDNTTLSITSSIWLESGTGFFVTILDKKIIKEKRRKKEVNIKDKTCL